MRELVLFLAKSLVDQPDAVQVMETEGPEAIILELTVAPEDMGKVIGKQGRIAKEVLHSTRHSSDVAKLVKGLMIESYIEDGFQKTGEHVYGCSITDPCLGWEKTERLVLDLAELR